MSTSTEPRPHTEDDMPLQIRTEEPEIMEPPAPRGLYLKLHRVMQDCAYIQRDKKNEHFKYTYASEAAIKDKLHESMVKHGVLFEPCGVDVMGEPVQRGQQWVTTVQIRYRFRDAETGEATPECSMPGSGADGVDKGVFKAITGALKYALTTTFLIATGDDPEDDEGRKKTRAEKKGDAEKVAAEKLARMRGDGPPDDFDLPDEPPAASAPPVSTNRKPGCISLPQQKRFFAICNEKGKKRDQVKAWLLSEYKIEHTADIPSAKYDEITARVGEI